MDEKNREIIVNFYQLNTNTGEIVQILGNDGTVFTHRKTQKGAIKFVWDNKLIPKYADYASLTRRIDWDSNRYGKILPLKILGLDSRAY